MTEVENAASQDLDPYGSVEDRAEAIAAALRTQHGITDFTRYLILHIIQLSN